jgi:hypothetical protein
MDQARRYGTYDAFSADTKRLVGDRVAWCCSMCYRSTVGPGDTETDIARIGDAAHIRAGSPGGPRDDPSLTPEERRASANAIWLCPSCHRLIDRRVETYTSERLTAIKAEAVHRADLALQQGIGLPLLGDVMRLQEHTQRTIGAEYASRILTLPEGTIRVQRGVADELVTALDNHSVLVVGVAGEGKSEVLLEAAQRFSSTPVLFFDATDDRMRDPRSALGLERTLEEILSTWPCDRGYLFIDGLDATRVAAFDALCRLLHVLRHTAPRWHVAAAIREYDLNHAPELRELFAVGTEQECVVRVGPLDDAELAAVGEQSAVFSRWRATASPELVTLIRNPFNLRIACEILTASGTAPTIGIDNRVALLDRWWEWRIARAQGGTGELQKRQTLRGIIRACLDARSLRVPTAVAEGRGTEVLLADGVLTHAGRYQEDLSFTHAILFDYVVFRLLLHEQTMAEFLAQDPDLALFALPSLRMRLEELWSYERSRFHSELDALFASGTRRTLLMIAVRVAAERAGNVEDLQPLLLACDPREVLYLIRVLIYLRDHGTTLTGEGRPWCDFALALARQGKHEHDAMLLVQELLRNTTLDAVDRTTLNEASRLNLRRELVREPYQPWLMRMAIEAFMRTYDVDPEAGRSLLSTLLENERLQSVGQFELEPIGFSVAHLHDPQALLAIYKAIFSEIVLAEGKVAIGAPSAIMGMIQDTRQTLTSARFQLGERFGAFLDEAPAQALEALAWVFEWRARQHHWNHKTIQVRFAGRVLELYEDGSATWDSMLFRLDDHAKMVDAFEQRLQRTLDEGDLRLFEAALDAFGKHAHALWLWRILVRNAARQPRAAELVLPLIAQRDILLAYDLGTAIEAFLGHAYPLLDDVARGVVDTALLSVVEGETNADLHRYRVERVKHFLARVPAESIANDRLRILLEEAQPVDPDDAHARELALTGAATSLPIAEPYTLREHAQAMGVDGALLEAISEADAYLDIRAIEGEASAQRQLRLERMRELACLAVAANEVAKAQAFDTICSIALGGLKSNAFVATDADELLGLIVEAVRIPDTSDLPDDDADEGLSWGAPYRFVDGLQACRYLYHLQPDQRVVEIAQTLSRHPRRVVRAFAVDVAQAFARDHFDEALVIARSAIDDRAIAVVRAGFQFACRLYAQDAQLATSLIVAVYDRLRGRALGSGQFAVEIFNALLDLALRGERLAEERVSGIVEDPWSAPDLAQKVVYAMAHRLAEQSDPPARDYARSLLQRMLSGAGEELVRLGATYGNDVDAYPQDVAEAAQQLYFVSGAMHAVGAYPDPGQLSAERFAFLEPLLEELVRVPFAAAAYYVIQTLAAAMRSAPQRSLNLALRAFAAAPALARDSMAEPEMRRFVLTYIREHRALLAGDPAAVAGVLDVVDAFIDAGLPQWLDIIFELDRVYRAA